MPFIINIVWMLITKLKEDLCIFFSDPRTFSCAALALPEQFSEETLDWSG